MGSAVVRATSQYADLLLLHSAFSDRYPFLLESVARGSTNSRFDVLFAFPQQQLVLRPNGQLISPEGSTSNETFLDGFDEWWRRERTDERACPQLPFDGGWFIYMAYELAQQIEPRLRLPLAFQKTLPIAFATRIPAAVIRDHTERAIYLVAEEDHRYLLDAMEQDLAGIQRNESGEKIGGLSESLQEEDPQRFLSGVRRIKDYIVAGDVFQVNLSRVWQGCFSPHVDAVTLYKRLRQTNPAPFAGLVRHRSNYILSSSPERLVKVSGERVETRPIAGTRPRGSGITLDRQLSEVLMSHPKERAEHIMLIDLERNDLGRICRAGSVKVNELMVLESYSHVHHIVSNVRGRLQPDTAPGQVVAAVFPGGTITGCPKVRCMEIIAELEGAPRGPYTGSFGYINRDGSMDLNILIRTLSVEENRISLRAGAGIVADSEPEMELAETRAKAQGILLALNSDQR